MIKLFHKLADIYYRVFYCSVIGHRYVQIEGTNKTRCITCNDEFEVKRK